ncbi:MAG: Co2+/Mg2+ efflux protein ApaG [Flavobacteriales bacterium]|nr:Co2+/Mg2+ efflux protein ApaG [Flavobacteriales bacterium]
MVTAISSGISISISCKFEPRFSNPENNLFMFSYRINIENRNDFTICLERRRWNIQDSAGPARKVDGEGVVGKQPVIPPGGSYSYRSSCDFSTDTGQMRGSYEMRNLDTDTLFEVEVPSFMLMIPHRLN